MQQLRHTIEDIEGQQTIVLFVPWTEKDGMIRSHDTEPYRTMKTTTRAFSVILYLGS